MKKSNLKFDYEVNLATLCTTCNMNQVTELQLRISIKNGLLTKIEQLVSEHIGLTFSNEYFLAYKSSSEVGAGILLDNEITFEEFLKDYKRYISNNKKNDNLELEVTSKETEEEVPKSKSVKTKKK
ncbi:7834_t:CDS:2, partial [Rhizophagus irregularis]